MEAFEPSPRDEYEDDEDREHEATAGPRGKTGLGPLPRWQKVLLGMAGLFVLVGLGLQGFALTRGDGSTAGGDAAVAERQAVDSPDSALVTQSQQGDGPGVRFHDFDGFVEKKRKDGFFREGRPGVFQDFPEKHQLLVLPGGALHGFQALVLLTKKQKTDSILSLFSCFAFEKAKMDDSPFERHGTYGFIGKSGP